MRALVTGAGGFVGAHLCRRLEDDGWRVLRATRDAVDLTDPVATASFACRADPDVIFDLAATRAESTPAQRAATIAVNAYSGGWAINAVGERCRTVVRLGSSTEYAEADGPMDETTPLRSRGFFGATKAAGSALVTAAAAARGMRATVLRAFQVYGPGDKPHRLVPTALRAARSGEALPMTAPGMRRDWIHVDDVVEACLRAALADHLPPGQVLNVGTGVQTANEELVALVERVSARPVRMAAGAHPGCPWDTSSWVSDPSLAADLLGWQAKVDLEDGLRRCWAAM